jgi:hypothetical protein
LHSICTFPPTLFCPKPDLDPIFSCCTNALQSGQKTYLWSSQDHALSGATIRLFDFVSSLLRWHLLHTFQAKDATELWTDNTPNAKDGADEFLQYRPLLLEREDRDQDNNCIIHMPALPSPATARPTMNNDELAAAPQTADPASKNCYGESKVSVGRALTRGCIGDPRKVGKHTA